MTTDTQPESDDTADSSDKVPSTSGDVGESEKPADYENPGRVQRRTEIWDDPFRGRRTPFINPGRSSK